MTTRPGLHREIHERSRRAADASTPEEKVAGVVAWLREHPAVESGPSVRAALALTDLSSAWRSVSGEADFLRMALLALPHRLRVARGVDPDDLVRQAVAAVEQGERSPDVELIDVPHRRRRRRDVSDPSARIGPAPRQTRLGPSVLTEKTTQRLLADLLAPARIWESSSGPTPVLPAPRLPGEEPIMVAPLGPGDRSRDLSVRHSLRAAVRSGELGARELRVLRREPTARYDVVLVLDMSASMADPETAFAAAACRTLAEALVRAGQRVGMVAFADDAVVAQELTRDRRDLDPEEYEFGRSTNIEAGLEAARRLLLAGSVNGHRRRIVLISDAEATSYTTAPPLVPARFNRPMAERYPGRAGHPIHDARRAALLAARRCVREDIVVSVAQPGSMSDARFARLLAAAGGGVVRTLDPSMAVIRSFAPTG